MDKKLYSQRQMDAVIKKLSQEVGVKTYLDLCWNGGALPSLTIEEDTLAACKGIVKRILEEGGK